MSDNDTKPTAEYGADSDVARFFGIHPSRSDDGMPAPN
jgi:hypothetical protein